MQRIGQLGPQAFEREFAILELRPAIGRGRGRDGPEPLEEARPLARAERLRTLDVEAHLGSGVRCVRVLTARTPRGTEAPFKLVERNDTVPRDAQTLGCHDRRLTVRQTGTMRTRRRWIAIGLVTFTGLFGACSDDGGSAPTYTAAPTDDDPGPNDTSDAPQTVQGVLRLDPATTCLTLETETGRLSLTFDGYSLGDDGGTPALIADVDDRVVAVDGDNVVLSGRPVAAEALNPCGDPFNVESFNSVLPSGSPTS